MAKTYLGVRALAERVNAGVGAARTVHGDVSARDLLQSLLRMSWMVFATFEIASPSRLFRRRR